MGIKRIFVLAVMVAASVAWGQITVSDWNANSITIRTAEDLRELARRTNSTNAAERGDRFYGQTITLANDINLNGSEQNQWVPIGNFQGTFDGGNNVIRGVFINDVTTTSSLGLFESNGGIIKNLGVIVNITGNHNVGGLVGENFSTIENCYVEGVVSGSHNVGGLVGRAAHGGLGMSFELLVGRISNSYATANVTGTGSRIGGLAGISGGTIENSHATGNVTGTGNVTAIESADDIGGLVGGMSGTIKNSYATGNVTGASSNIGGLVGAIFGEQSIIIDCYATGDVIGDMSRIGGLVGMNGSFAVSGGIIRNSHATGNVTGNNRIGGLVGDNQRGSIIDCYATGDVTAEAFVGGLTGQNDGTIEKSYATGNVTGTRIIQFTYVGGLVGQNNRTIKNSYATGNVNGRLHIGGLVGDNTRIIENSYAIGTVTIGGGLVGTQATITGRITTSSYHTGMDNRIGTFVSTEEMKEQTTFIDWDFEDIWEIDERINNGFPHLISLKESYCIVDFGDWIIIAATCTEAGSKTRTRTCSRCGEKSPETVEIPALGHDMPQDWTIIPATCTTDGDSTKVCARENCDHKEVKIIEALGHDFGDWTITPATCFAAGDSTRICSRGDSTEVRIIEQLTGDDCRINITADFTDTNFLAAVYEIIGKTAPAPIFDIDVKDIDTLDLQIINEVRAARNEATISTIRNLSGIEHFVSLKYLNVSGHDLTELDLSKNVNLTYLNVDDNRIASITDIKGLDNTQINLQEFNFGEQRPTSIRNRQATDNRFGIIVAENPVPDFARISVITPEPATINLRIMDNLGNVVFTETAVGAGFKPAPTNAADNAIIWNLTNTNGRYVANGTYLIIVEATGISGRRYTYSSRIGVSR